MLKKIDMLGCEENKLTNDVLMMSKIRILYCPVTKFPIEIDQKLNFGLVIM